MIQGFWMEKDKTRFFFPVEPEGIAPTSFSTLVQQRQVKLRAKATSNQVTKCGKEHPNLFISRLGFDAHLSDLDFHQVLALSGNTPAPSGWVRPFSRLMKTLTTAFHQRFPSKVVFRQD